MTAVPTVPEDTAPYNFFLRDPISDEIRPQPCRGCGEPLRDFQSEMRHQMSHVRDGHLVAYLGTGLPVSFATADEHAQRERSTRRYGGRLDTPLPVEALDATTNGVRVVCPVCRDFLYDRFDPQTGAYQWVHYPRLHPVVGDGRVWRWQRSGAEYIAEHDVPWPLPQQIVRPDDAAPHPEVRTTDHDDETGTSGIVPLPNDPPELAALKRNRAALWQAIKDREPSLTLANVTFGDGTDVTMHLSTLAALLGVPLDEVPE